MMQNKFFTLNNMMMRDPLYSFFSVSAAVVVFLFLSCFHVAVSEQPTTFGVKPSEQYLYDIRNGNNV